ncbi:hypothetical protein [Granulicoccus phenolivorans]|uniref:hypothetical protein n=1 Tax=Granulicoccus phenolivorans TaxID=266854 RepID=UPI0004284812|nr:hypothetical protein [Granulicoccus phenolivorans]
MTTDELTPAAAAADAAAPGAGHEIELYAFDFDTFDHFPAIDAAAEVTAVADLLADFGVCTKRPWAEPMPSRGGDAVNQRFADWGIANGPTILYWVGHGWARGRQAAALAHARSPESVEEMGVTPAAMGAAIANWEARAPEDAWLLVIIEACKSGTFISNLVSVMEEKEGPNQIAFLAAANDSSANLGELRRALEQVLQHTFARDDEIPVDDLVDELTGTIHSKRRFLDIDKNARLVRIHRLTEATRTPVEASPVDPNQVLGAAREAVLDRLDRTGYVVVSGPPGGGKSSLLRDVAATEDRVDAGFSVAGLNAEETQRLVDRHTSGPGHTRLIVDGVDRAADPPAVARVLRQVGHRADVDLAVGTRPELYAELGVAPGEVIRVQCDTDLIRTSITDGLAPLVAAGELTAAQVAAVTTDVLGAEQEILYARLVVHEILARPRLAREGAVTQALGRTPTAVFAKAVARLRSNNRAVRPLFTALALSRGGGLPIRDGVWAAVGSAIARRTISPTAVHRFVAEAGPYLASASRDRQTVYRLDQRTYVDYLARDPAQVREYQLRIAHRGEAELARAQGHRVNPYWIHHLADHWAAAEGW